MLTVQRIAIYLVLLAGAAAASACIFDKGGDYNGGGRRDTGAKFGEQEQLPDLDSGSSEDDEQDSGVNPIPDTGVGGG